MPFELTVIDLRRGMEWVVSFSNNFKKVGRGYSNSEVMVILYVLFVVTELHFDSIFLPKNNIKLKNYKDFKNLKPLSLKVSNKALTILN